MIDADGSIMGVYRKSHIPDGPGYQEKFYFNPGNTGFKVWNTTGAKIGVGICWDQWFPEAARSMVLQGAEILLSNSNWRRARDDGFDKFGHVATSDDSRHSVQNQVPVIASNRIGTEQGIDNSNYFYGRSFVTNHVGDKIAEADRRDSAGADWRVDLKRQRPAKRGYL